MALSQGTAYFDPETVASAVTAAQQKLHARDFVSDYVVGAMPTTPGGGLIMTIPDLIGYVGGLRVSVVAFAYTFAASSDTYVDVGSDGVIDLNAVANGGAEPTLAASHVRMFKVVTNASNITVLLDLRPYVPYANWIEGLRVEYVSNTQIRVGGGSCYLPSAGRIVSTKDPAGIPSKTITPVANTWYFIYVFEGADGYLDFEIIPDTDVSPFPSSTPYAGTARLRTGSLTRRYIGDAKAWTSARLMKWRDTVKGSAVERYWSESVWTGSPLLVLSAGAATASTLINLTGANPGGVPNHDAAREAHIWCYNSNTTFVFYLGEALTSFTLSATEFSHFIHTLQTSLWTANISQGRQVRYINQAAQGSSNLAVRGYTIER